MAEITLKTDYPEKAHQILFETIELEVARIKHSLMFTQKKLLKYEKKYQIASDQFIENITAEDLEGGDLEYIEWAGEHKLAVSLNERLNTLKSMIHDAPKLS